MRRSLTAGLLIAVLAASLTGCYPTASNAIADLERFAVQLDGVESVETLVDTPENMAFPFGGTALGVAAVHLGDSWREELPDVALAVQDWLANDQKREKVELSVAIIFPSGALGLADQASDTRDRIELIELLADDARVTDLRVGFWGDSTVDPDTASITLERTPEATLAELLTDYSTEFGTLSPQGFVEIVTGSDATTDDTARSLTIAAPTAAESPVVTWADAVDLITTVTGWRVSESGEATVYAADAAQLDSLDAALRALPGFEAISSLTLESPELTVESGDDSVARELAGALAADGISGVSVSRGVLTVGTIDTDGARTVLATAAAIPGAEDVMADLEISLGALDANPCACIRMRDANLGYLSAVLPPLLELEPTALDQIWVRGETAVDASYESDDRAAMSAFFAAVHEQAIAGGTSVAVSVDAGNDYYIVKFDAAPQITADDVWSGNNNTKQDKRHAEVIDLWNALDN